MYRLNPHKTYSPGVLTGNWCEDSAAAEIKLAEYHEKKGKGSLKIQEFDQWKTSVTAKLGQGISDKPSDAVAIPFGSVIKLVSVENDTLISVDYFERIFDDGTKILLTLGNGMLSDKDLFSKSDFSVTGTPNKEGQFRSSFRVVPFNDEFALDPPSDHLKFGNKVVLETLDDSVVPKHFLRSLPLNNVNFGSMSGRHDVSVTQNFDYSCVWEIVKENRKNNSWDLEENLKVGQKFCFRNCQTNSELFVGSRKRKNFFGSENEIGSHGHLKILQMNEKVNPNAHLWKIEI